MLRATFKSLLSRKLRLILSGLAVVLGVMFVVRLVRADQHAVELVRQPVCQRLLARRGPGQSAKPKIDDSDDPRTDDPATTYRPSVINQINGCARRRRARPVSSGRRRARHRQERQGPEPPRAHRSSASTGPAPAASAPSRPAGRPTAPDEIVVDNGVRRPGRSTSATRSASRSTASQQHVHARRHLRLQRRPRLARRRADGRVHHAGRAAIDAGTIRAFSSIDVKPGRRAFSDTRCRTDVAKRSAPATSRKPASSSPPTSRRRSATACSGSSTTSSSASPVSRCSSASS